MWPVYSFLFCQVFFVFLSFLRAWTAGRLARLSQTETDRHGGANSVVCAKVRRRGSEFGLFPFFFLIVVGDWYVYLIFFGGGKNCFVRLFDSSLRGEVFVPLFFVFFGPFGS